MNKSKIHYMTKIIHKAGITVSFGLLGSDSELFNPSSSHASKIPELASY